VLNARLHEREAEIVAQAGRPGAVTISTNMAGRGTDIKLGGADEADRDRAVAAGGLLVIGTGEHESMRIDNQLRGRAGRQGDPGASIYLVSIDDPVYRRFGQKKALPELRDRLADHPDGEPVADPVALAALDALRRKVEVENQAIRLDVFKYDSVVHERRETIWGWRRSLLLTQDRDAWVEHVGEVVTELVGRLGEDADVEAESAEREGPQRAARQKWSSILRLILAWLPAEALDDVAVTEAEQVAEHLMERYLARLEAPAEVVDALIEWERQVLLSIIDTLWPQYLNDLERVEEGIWLRGYAERDPFVEFRREAAVMFGQLMRDIELDALRAWLSVEVIEADQPPPASSVVPSVPGPAERKKIRR
jgi:preprotein translocase subunit SecA